MNNVFCFLCVFLVFFFSQNFFLGAEMLCIIFKYFSRCYFHPISRFLYMIVMLTAAQIDVSHILFFFFFNVNYPIYSFGNPVRIYHYCLHFTIEDSLRLDSCLSKLSSHI